MYMGVILTSVSLPLRLFGAPHVYGGDPLDKELIGAFALCSPCIWG